MTSPSPLEARIALQAAREAAQAHRTHVLHFIRRQKPLTPEEEVLLAQFRRIELTALRQAGISAHPDRIPVLTEVQL